MLADLVMLDDDPTAAPIDKTLDIKVLETLRRAKAFISARQPDLLPFTSPAAIWELAGVFFLCFGFCRLADRMIARGNVSK